MTDYKKWEEIEKNIPDDEEDKARQRLREQKDNMTQQEVQRLHECWEKPEFKAMFQEYADEVSDPANRAETEKYLAQCEAEGRAEELAKQGFLNGRSTSEFQGSDDYQGQGGGPAVSPLGDSVPGQPNGPEGQQLLKPHEGFVVKTWKRDAGKKDFERDYGKVFINVCQHDDIDPPTATDVTTPDGRQGQSWSMPHLCSPAPKEEKDKAGHNCLVIDIVFHTEVLKRCGAPHGLGDRWKGMVVTTALEMVGKLHKLDLDMQEHKVLNTKYFCPSTQAEGPNTLSWRPGKAFDEKKPAVDDPASHPKNKKKGNKGAAGAADKKQAAGAAGAATAPPAAPAAAAAAAAPASNTKPAAAAASSSSSSSSSSKPAGKRAKRAPKYSVVHRGVADLGQGWNDGRLASSGRPRELLVKVELPDLTSAAGIDLDITERKLELSHDGASYELSVSLPFAVLSEQGAAKFDKAKRVLSVTLPVSAEVAPMPQWQPTDQGQTEDELAAEEAAEKALEAEVAKVREAAEAERKAAAERAKAEAKREEEEREARKKAAIAQAEKEAARRAAAAAKKAKEPSPSPPPPAAAAAKPPPPSKPAAAAPAAPAAVETPSGGSGGGSKASSDSEWEVVDQADAGAASKEKPAAPPPAASKKQAATAAAPAAPTAAPTGAAGGGLKPFSNGLLFELD